MCERGNKGLTAFPLLTSGDGPTGQPGQLKEANRQAAESQRPLGRFPPGLTLTYGLSFHQCFIFDCFHCLLLTHGQHFLKGTPTLLFVCGHIYSSVESPASSSTAQLLQYLVSKINSQNCFGIILGNFFFFWKNHRVAATVITAVIDVS